MSSNLYYTLLLLILCARVISAPLQHHPASTYPAQVETSAQIISSTTIRAFLAGLFIPVAIRFAIDTLDRLSGARPENIAFPMVKIVLLISYFYTSWAIGLALLVYAMSQNHLEIGFAAIGVLVALYPSNLSYSSSSRLKVLWRKLLRRSSTSPAQPSLLCYGLKQLTRLATSSDLWATIPFNEFVDLVAFCLLMNDEELSEKLTTTHGSLCITSKLRDIHRHVSDFKSLHDQGHEFVFHAFRTLLCQAIEPRYSKGLKFSSRVALVVYCVKLDDEQLVNILLDPNTGESRLSVINLPEIHVRLPDPDGLPKAGRRYLPAALQDLLRIAMEENSSAILPFCTQVQLVMSYLKTVGLNSVNDHPPWKVIKDMHGGRAMAVFRGVEGHWLRAWLRQLHGSTSEEDENQIIWNVAVHYSRT